MRLDRQTDGKEFLATLGALDGHVWYMRDGSWVGSARYTGIVGDCACGGESFSGDALCSGMSFEVACGQLDSERIELPFANGARIGPCLCTD